LWRSHLTGPAKQNMAGVLHPQFETHAVFARRRYNRCVMFNSALLHETDHFEFKKDYRSRRINLTLLFGNFANANGDESLKNVASYVT